MQTLYQVLQKQHPRSVELWDKHDYTVYAPVSLDDLAVIVVHLRNAAGDVIGVSLYLENGE